MSAPIPPLSVSSPIPPSSLLLPIFPTIELLSSLPVPLIASEPVNERFSMFAPRVQFILEFTVSVH